MVDGTADRRCRGDAFRVGRRWAGWLAECVARCVMGGWGTVRLRAGGGLRRWARRLQQGEAFSMERHCRAGGLADEAFVTSQVGLGNRSPLHVDGFVFQQWIYDVQFPYLAIIESCVERSGSIIVTDYAGCKRYILQSGFLGQSFRETIAACDDFRVCHLSCLGI